MKQRNRDDNTIEHTLPDGGAAFPEINFDGYHSQMSGGMTLRDWFAGQALSGLMAYPEDTAIFKTVQDSVRHYAATAYAYADAMIAEREKQP